MLKVTGSVYPKGGQLEIDDYVPFVFRIEESQKFVPLYWRTGDFKSSLLEIGLNPKNGAVMLVKIPFFGKFKMKAVSWISPSGNIIKGLPVCDIHQWSKSGKFQENFQDEPNAFQTIIGNDFVSFLFKPEATLNSFFIHGQVIIGVDEAKTIQKIEFINISQEEIRKIIPSLRS